jgi:integrase
MGKRISTAVWLENESRWQIKVQKDGKRKTFTSSTPGRTGQRECNKKADDFLDNNIVDPKIKFEKACIEYLQIIIDTTSKGNAKNYEYFINKRIIPFIGNIRMESLTEKHLQTVLYEGFKDGLSKKTLTSIKACLTSVIKYCRSAKYTTLLAENLTIPKSASVGLRNILQPDELAMLFSSDKTLYSGKEIFDIYIYAYRFQVITGLRPGELIGLKWEDVNGDTVRLKRAINIFGDTTKGKNENAARVFSLTQTAKEILLKQRDLQSSLNIESEFIFTNKFGEHLKEKSYYDCWRKYRNIITYRQMYRFTNYVIHLFQW